ncbi:RCC1 domain-containing protein, partial [Bdellovibrio sp. GT3]|uniref:RCC1 domain-containing protein n=1 Tax=Bdellovibrio sp. GT3 TaxID=3136282 RepID=UPI0030F0E327
MMTNKFSLLLIATSTQILTGCLSGSGGGGFSSPSNDAISNYQGTYSYTTPSLAIGDGTVEVAATAILSCIETTTGNSVSNALCPPASSAPKRSYQSPAGSIDIAITGAVGGKATVGVALGEHFDTGTQAGQNKIAAALVCDTAYEKTGSTCEVAILKAKLLRNTGGSGTCVITLEDKVKCFGTGYFGSGTSSAFSVPTEVTVFQGAKDIALGAHMCAIMSDNSVKCGGRNNYGQLGLGDTTDRATPVTVSGFQGAKSIYTGPFTTCAIFNDNSVKCTGANGLGTLGLGDYNDRKILP